MHEPTLKVITFVDISATNFLLIHRALVEAQAIFAQDAEVLEIDYSEPKRVLASMEKAAESESREKAVRELRKALESGAPDCRVEPIRLTVRLQEDFFEFALSLRMLQCPSG